MAVPLRNPTKSGTTAPTPGDVVINGVTKVYGTGPAALLALDRVSLRVRNGEFLCIVGASGCGKSTLLNLVSGLDSVTAGSIDTGGRHSAMLFQESALFPWLTVAQNIDLPMRLKGMAAATRAARVEELLVTVHLEGFGAKRPHELSGGMRQRAALARALAQEPEILLMDEPFGALDAMTRDFLHDELERIWNDTGITILFVTHNVREAARLGDRVVVLSSRPGKVVGDHPVDIPRPRRIESPEVAALAAHVTDHLRREVRRHGR